MAESPEIDYYAGQKNLIYLKTYFSNYDFQEQFYKLSNVFSSIESYNEQLKQKVKLHANNLIHSIKMKYKKKSQSNTSSRSKNSKNSSKKCSSTSLNTEKKSKPTTIQSYIEETRQDFIKNNALNYQNHQDFLEVNRQIEKILTDCFNEFSRLFPEKNFFESQQLSLSEKESESDLESELQKAISQLGIDENGESELKNIVNNRNECIEFIDFEKFRLINELPLLYKQETKELLEKELNKIKNVTAMSNDLNILFSEKLNLDSLAKKIDYLVFCNKKIVFNDDGFLKLGVSANRFFSYKKSFDLNSAVEMFKNDEIYGQIGFLRNIPLQGPFVELKHDMIASKLNVSIDHGSIPKSVLISEIEQIISMKINCNGTILIEAIKSPSHKDFIIHLNYESDLKVLNIKPSEQVLTVDEDTFDYQFYDGSLVLNKVSFQNYDENKKFFLNFKNVYSINQFEFRHDKYFFRLNADNGQDAFIFVYDLEGNCIRSILTDGQFKIGSKKLFIHEGEYLKCYCLNSLCLLQETELIRSIEHLKNFPVVQFHVDFEDNCYFSDNIRIYKIVG